MASVQSVSSSQAWAILSRHARDEISPLRLQELCRDNDRVSSMVSVHNASDNGILLVDLSRQRMTLDTINHLLQLGVARNLRGFIQMLAWGQNDPNNPIVPARNRRDGYRYNDDETSQHHRTSSPTMHLALRAPSNAGLEMLTHDGTNALVEIHSDWERIQRLSDSVRHGKLRGSSGNALRDVVVVGQGVPFMALKFMYQALMRDKAGRNAALDGAHEGQHSRRRLGGWSASYRRMRFLSSTDPISASSALDGLDPGCTIVVTIDLQGNDEIVLASQTCKSWLLRSLGSSKRADLVLTKHMLLVTANRILATNHKRESVFVVPSHSQCEAFTTFTAASLLPLSFIFGWKLVKQILAGAHDIDKHFVETNPRHNLPVLLALSDVWNDVFFGSHGRVVTPFTKAFDSLPAFVATLESQTCGRSGDAINSQTKQTPSCSPMVIDGGVDGALDRAMYQCERVIPSELVMAMDTQAGANSSHAVDFEYLDEILANQDARMCSLFAHADTLAFGSDVMMSSFRSNGGGAVLRTADSFGSSGSGSPMDIAEGNRPSALLICGKCDAFTCGQLIALSEHRAAVKAHLWDLDPFTRTVGSHLRSGRAEKLRGELHKLYTKIAPPGKEADDDEDVEESTLNMATSTILSHYANLMRDQRLNIVRHS